jgi:protein gp37
MRSRHPNEAVRRSNAGLTLPHPETSKPYFNGIVRMREDLLDLPLKTKKPTIWAIWTDLFHKDVPADVQQKAWEVMARCNRHTFLILTKRPNRMLMAASVLNDISLLNVWLGVTVENQETANGRIPLLLKTPAAKRFISVEPMLGEINFRMDSLDWVICGGESGHGARPMHPDWARSLRDQCKSAGVPFWFKGWGKHVPAGQIKGLLDGVEYKEWPI